MNTGMQTIADLKSLIKLKCNTMTPYKEKAETRGQRGQTVAVRLRLWQ